jgi:hypothetical protein
LVNAERYITQELKEYEEKILGAEDKILVLETRLYTELVQALSEFIPAIQINANQIARIDCLLSFANVAKENNYIRPVIEDNDVLDIRQGRHPVIEKQLPIGEKYIANDVLLDNATQQVIIITGPNMAGKSALLRQTALITLLANLMNSEIIGKVTDVSWAFVFERVDMQPRHPAQLYEAIAYFILFLVMMFLYKNYSKKLHRGFFFGLCLTAIFTFRFFVEFLKENQVDFENSMALNMGQWLSIPFVIIGIYFMFFYGKKKSVK